MRENFPLSLWSRSIDVFHIAGHMCFHYILDLDLLNCLIILSFHLRGGLCAVVSCVCWIPFHNCTGLSLQCAAQKNLSFFCDHIIYSVVLLNYLVSNVFMQQYSQQGSILKPSDSSPNNLWNNTILLWRLEIILIVMCLKKKIRMIVQIMHEILGGVKSLVTWSTNITVKCWACLIATCWIWLFGLEHQNPLF